MIFCYKKQIPYVPTSCDSTENVEQSEYFPQFWALKPYLYLFFPFLIRLQRKSLRKHYITAKITQDI
jgi:hypothetical protein